MQQTLQTTKTSATAWAESLVPTLPFIVALCVGSRRVWQDTNSGQTIKLPASPGVYLIYPLTDDSPVYIGESSDLCRRLTYHFADSDSSNKESTLKKNLRRDGLSDGRPLHLCFRLRFIVLPFGRTEIEEHLHANHKINTRRI